MQKPSSVTIQDLLLSEPTTSLIERMKSLKMALYHVQAFGKRQEHGQRVRSIGLKQRDGALFVEVEVVSRANPPLKSLLLVEDEWDVFTNLYGGDDMGVGSHDARFALAEIECRLRQDPALADSYPGTNANYTAGVAPVTLPVPLPAEAKPAGNGAAAVGSPRPVVPTRPEATTTNGHQTRAGAGTEGDEPTPEEMEAAGTPREVFKEQSRGDV